MEQIILLVDILFREIGFFKGNMSSEAIALRSRIEEIKSQITDLEEKHRDQEQYLKKLRLLYNQSPLCSGKKV